MGQYLALQYGKTGLTDQSKHYTSRMGVKNPPENKTLASLLSAYTQAVSEDGSCEYPWGNRAGCRQSLRHFP